MYGGLAVGYVRVSTDEQTLGAEAQRKAIIEYAAREGLQVVKIYEDIGVSGGVPALERPGFRRLVEEAPRLGAANIIIYSLDRLGRSARDILNTLQVLAEKGFRVHSVRRDIPDSVKDPVIARGIIMLMGWAAELERKMIRDRTRQALQAKGVSHEIRLPEETVEAIARLYREGHGYGYIARTLGLSVYKVRQVLVRLALVPIDPDICPRCLHRMKYDEQYGTLVCPKCGYIHGDERYKKWEEGVVRLSESRARHVVVRDRSGSRA